jgi:hypothetical protein
LHCVSDLREQWNAGPQCIGCSTVRVKHWRVEKQLTFLLDDQMMFERKEWREEQSRLINATIKYSQQINNVT